MGIAWFKFRKEERRFWLRTTALLGEERREEGEGEIAICWARKGTSAVILEREVSMCREGWMCLIMEIMP